MRQLVIRHEQMEAFSEALERDFVVRATRDLRSRFAQAAAGITGEQFSVLVQQAVARARSIGIKKRDDLERFLEFEILYGPNFENSHPALNQILRQANLEGSDKMDMIENWELFERCD